MSDRPDIILFIMDAAQASALEPGNPCLTPNFDRLRERGLVSIEPIAQPHLLALSSEFDDRMLPHNHGVLEVEHGRDPNRAFCGPTSLTSPSA